MIKADLAWVVARTSDLTDQQAKLVVQTVLDSIVEALTSGEEVELRGFGSFRLRDRGQRMWRTPKTSKELQSPANRVVHFKLSKELKKLINSEDPE